MKLKLCIHVHDIILYINCFFIVIAHVLSLLWQLKVSIDMKLKLCIHVHDISLYISYVFFIVIAHVLSLLWQLKVSIDL